MKNDKGKKSLPVPPIETRWKPGQSGNPSGRKWGSRNRRTLFKQFLKLEFRDKDGNAVYHTGENENDVGPPMTVADVLALKTIQYAIDGDHHARRDVLDAVFDGKSSQALDGEDHDEGEAAIDFDQLSEEESARLYQEMIKRC